MTKKIAWLRRQTFEKFYNNFATKERRRLIKFSMQKDFKNLPGKVFIFRYQRN